MRSAFNFILGLVALAAAIVGGWFFYQMKTEEASKKAPEVSEAESGSAPSVRAFGNGQMPSISSDETEDKPASEVASITEPEPPAATEEEEEYDGPRCRITYPDLGEYLQGKPVVIRSQRLDDATRRLMERQVLLFKSVMGLEDEDKKAELNRRFIELCAAIPEPDGRGGYKYDLGEDTLYAIPVREQSDARMVRDFRLPLQNGSLDTIDYIVATLQSRNDKWQEILVKTAPSGSGSTSDARYLQYGANRAFLRRMPGYIEHWVSLQEDLKAFREDRLETSAARAQWAAFEADGLPQLNAYIETDVKGTWELDDNDIIETGRWDRDRTYLQLNVVGRLMYFPLDTGWDPALGISMLDPE
ncbi:hypothetical protein [Ruficoccus sp. ZRK36]|uniref:hypothetical protein n=1 Tax=Ruficoccus sp. ZRK36 TaxID=2866311 RepID=UPI001C73428E|nr:hypothetical protein [Ruficoccus sp. ZRK36]QYY36794.1 hypothetical protein K0V07_04785 [Ruficoccus sp. ZRK36]